MPATERVEPDPKSTLLRLAGALAEAAAVDWEAERAASPDQARELTNLQRLEALRLVFSRSGASSSDHVQPEAAHEIPMPSLWGHLEIVRRIGVGAFAEVYLAYDPQLDTRVALKLLHVERIATDKERFLKEARRLARVQHANVVTVHGVAEHDGRPGFWMDYLQGPNLEKRLHEQGRIAWHAAAMLGVEMCDALSAVHDAGLFHGDVKAANVVWCENAGKHVLMDLGAAAEAQPSGVHRSSTCGTPAVMAPEVYLGKARPSPASDVYSLGVLLYRLVSGSYPVEAKNEKELHHKLSDRDFAPVPLRDRRADLPLRFIRAVEHALEKPPKRYAQAGEFQRALLEAVDPHDPEVNVTYYRVPDAALLQTPDSVRRSGQVLAGYDDVSWWHKLLRWIEPLPRWQKGLAAAVPLAVAVYFMPAPPLRPHYFVTRDVEGTPQVLASGAEVFPGDKLSMAFESSQRAFVYVFNENDTRLGELNTLFPLGFSELQNPLERKAIHVLPGRANGVPIPWPVDDTGGTERILVVASKEPLRNLEERVRGQSDASRGASPANGESLRGPAVEDEDALRSIIVPVQIKVSQIDLILRDLGKPNRNVQWSLIELQNKARP